MIVSVVKLVYVKVGGEGVDMNICVWIIQVSIDGKCYMDVVWIYNNM